MSDYDFVERAEGAEMASDRANELIRLVAEAVRDACETAAASRDGEAAVQVQMVDIDAIIAEVTGS